MFAQLHVPHHHVPHPRTWYGWVALGAGVYVVILAVSIAYGTRF